MEFPLRSIESRCRGILNDLTSLKDMYGLSLTAAPSGAVLIDAGKDAPGSYSAGALITELCQGGLAKASIRPEKLGPCDLPYISVETFFPQTANLFLQQACSFEGQMISGPVKLCLENGVRPEDTSSAVFTAVIQGDQMPDDTWIRSLAAAAGCQPDSLTLVLVPQQSAAGGTQISGRMNENAVFTMERSLGIDTSIIRHILGTCPIGPFGPPAEGKKLLLPDDYIHYAASACLVVEAPDGMDIQKLARDLTFESTDICGKLFIDLLEEADWDFFKIPNVLHINKLSEITVADVRSGKTACAGKKRISLLTDQLL